MIYDNLNKTITSKRLVLRVFQKSDAVAVTNFVIIIIFIKIHCTYLIHTL
ncbi:hypothetical protein GCM10009597_39980 [Peribacillus frigoritolerans]